jgi:hypothetical protein
MTALTIGVIGMLTLAPELRGRSADGTAFTVHEWGTFTSIAGADGRAVRWRTLGGPSDLPSFVSQCGGNLKAGVLGTVRMETPVIYFYSPEEITVSAGVDFPEGFISDWFPTPTLKPAAGGVAPGSQFSFSRISWKNLRVLPHAPADFPTESGASHYYAARDTDASPLLVGADSERFLFYRGVGQFAPPLNARVQEDDSVVVASAGAWPVGTVVAFENRNGRVAHRVYRDIGWEHTLMPLAIEDESEGPAADLAGILVASGLYQKEAEAMVRTWRDSWFEEGSRLFYIAPADVVNGLLPLTISPSASSVARVFVGRVELVTPKTRHDVARALESGNGDAIRPYARFLEPIADRILAETPAIDRSQFARNLATATAQLGAVTAIPVPPVSCR